MEFLKIFLINCFINNEIYCFLLYLIYFIYLKIKFEFKPRQFRMELSFSFQLHEEKQYLDFSLNLSVFK